ncbi:type I restriction endonuclease subunit R [Helicobacter sp. 13S00477-4]|uniref:type I restriction endonuclease subunit R n=1 Tax=Helicobacter sp. 13S00477-4 TaxID=1905759 RepID=UPI000BA5990F|nr:type I restriction endonuclease subunit R [Helicobacter sp. 13S00477-4]PAF52537.1 DEAD/DEAH box helicase [Helicobacter sp. 13S00477-4]
MINNLISQNPNSTIIANYVREKRKNKSYQSEAELEEKLLQDLQAQGYERKPIKSLEELEPNLKIQLEKLNDITFSQNEWDRFYKNILTNPQKTPEDKTEMLQTQMHTEPLTRDDGSIKNIKLIDREDIFNNSLQVISQLENNEGKYKNRYDVTILVNGLPLVHIELKKRGIDLKEAFNQIKRYNRESFWAGNRLFEFVQIFVISNGTKTKYYSNSTRNKLENSKNLNNHFAFCINFSDFENNIIEELEDFTKTFFANRTLLNILTKFCVFNTNKELLVMRPYQIAASESIIYRIILAHNEKLYGKVQAGGYIWHSTGSGKTLTSFKTALLACELKFIKKVIFVVDRKDLDYQTMREYDSFQKGSANATKNTDALKKLIESDNNNEKIIITTIQKLSKFVTKYGNSDVFNKEIVFIFDECHRSQFGSMHDQIKKKFKKYYIFGFTGTPIFQENAAKNYTSIKTKNLSGQTIQKATIKTTDLIFGTQLHAYTILNAIGDHNVLPFKVEYLSTMKEEENISDEQVEDIQKESALLHKDRIHKIVNYTLEHFDQKTKRKNHYNLNNKKILGFNSIFATASVEFAKAYYLEFKKQLAGKQDGIKVGIIYSYAPNEDIDDDIDPGAENQDSKTFLESAIQDYNAIFKSNFSLNNFDDYYKDVSFRLKNKELDLLIVVNMFLTGFDSKTINTLWVDKNLRHHGLLQSFSRTNRILNDVKSFGNIVCFRNLEKATNDSLKMFGDKDAKNIVLLRTFEEYLKGYDDENGKHQIGYNELVIELEEKFSLDNFPLKSDKQKKEFIQCFGQLLKLKNILDVFDDFSDQNTLDKALEQDYQSQYIELHQQIENAKEKASIENDISFEIELIRQVEVDVDYILFLLEGYYKNKEENSKKSILRMVDSSISLRNKRDLIHSFLEEIDKKQDEEFNQLFENFIKEKQKNELQKIIKDENLNEEKTKEFLENAFEINKFQDLGTDIDNALPEIPLFQPPEIQAKNREKRENIISKLKNFFERFKDMRKNLPLR